MRKAALLLNAVIGPPVSRWAPVGLLAAALAVRAGIMVAHPAPLDSDPDGYRNLARNLCQHATFGHGTTPTAYRPPLYPLTLAPCVALGPAATWAIAALHVVLGVATVWLVYRLGCHCGLGRYALLAAMLVACDPILLVQSTLVMTETLAAFLAALALWMLARAAGRPSCLLSMGAGASIGLAALCRPTFLVWLGLAAVVFPLFSGSWPARARTAAAFAAGALVALAPWAVRNQVQFGRPILGTTHGGFTLLLGNNPSFYEYLGRRAWGEVWDSDRFNARWIGRMAAGGPGAELENDRLAYGEAWRTICGQPRTFAYSCLVRAGRFWQLVPHRLRANEGPRRTASRWVVGLWYLAEFALAAVGVAALGVARSKGRRLPGQSGPGRVTPWASVWCWGLLLALSLTAVHTVYWSNMRMRAPVAPVVALAAALGTARILHGASNRKS
jgi:4-amino-4-deoxy-L-arabinose transferase-like glycosyltransferase